MAHGVSLVTQDIDLCIPFTAENLGRLQNALEGLHACHRLTPKRLPLELHDANMSAFRNLYLETDLGPIDCLGEVKGIGDFAAVLPLSEEIVLPQGTCRVLTIDGLIRAKKAMGRTHDQLTILQLRAIQERRRS